jgi:hypothetical protein
MHVRLSIDRAEESSTVGGCGERNAGQTGTAKSRSAWFSEVFLSVLSERWPMMSAQGTW